MTMTFAQAGAIAWRRRRDGYDVLLISTSSGKHLTIPKGLIDPGYTAVESVRNEAFEEAGIEGEITTEPVGNYAFPKWGGICEVKVYLMAVARILDLYPEKDLRRRTWIDYREAARRVKHAALGALILKLPEMLANLTDS